MPGPRCAFTLERFALSKLALYTMPPGIRSASRARCSATWRLSASSSRTQGPAMTKNASFRKMGTSVARLRERCGALAPLTFHFHCRGDEAGEQRMRTGGPRLELGMKLAADEPRMVGVFNDVD